MTDISMHEGGERFGIFAPFDNHEVKLSVSAVKNFLDPVNTDASLPLGVDAQGKEIGIMGKGDEIHIPGSMSRASALVIGPMLESSPSQTTILRLHKRGIVTKLLDAVRHREGQIKGHATIMPTTIQSES